MEWLYLPTGVLLGLSLFVDITIGDFSTGAFQAVRCMLVETAPSKCSDVAEVQVPSYLIKVFNDSPTSLHEALRSAKLAQLSNEQIASLPLALLYLIPRRRLSDLSGPQLATILQRHAGDTSLARQLIASVQQEKQLVELLKLSNLSQDVQHVLGESINEADLNRTLSSLPIKESLLAYLAPNVMLALDDMAFKVLLHLQGIQSQRLPKKETMHTIAQIAIKQHFPFTKIKWLVSGLSPDEIMNATLELELNYQHFKLDLTSAQARAVFDKIYKNVNLTKSDLIDYLPVLPKLTPSMLQRLPAPEYNYDSLIKLPLPQSLATACQIQEYIKANCNMTGKLPKVEDEEWGFRIHYLGQWVYTLPLRVLEEYLSAPLDTAQLLEIESPALSALQTYYLTGKGQAFDLRAHNSVKVSESLLQALPASELLSHPFGQITSTVVEHLASHLPADNLPRTFVFVSMISSVLSEGSILENLLDNSDINSIVSLVSPQDFKVAAPKMLKWFKHKNNFAPIIRQLPQQILAALLEQVQQSESWSWEHVLDRSHVSHLLIGGLTCQHIEQMEPGIFIPIMAEYNRHRRQAFPRNLQICSLQKLISYLKFKMLITQSDPSLGLISMLEPIEIESVGGYILAGLPIEALRASPYLSQILSTIGKLSNAELLSAANMTQLYSIALLALDKEGNADVYVTRNLVWFLPPNTTLVHFKLMLQSELLDTTVCLPKHLRHSLATRLKAEFGSPEVWSAGVLATLRDLLLVFTEEDFSMISRDVRTDAIDTLSSHYGDSINWIKPMPFHQLCTSLLEEEEEMEYKSAVGRLIKWQLQAAQRLLNTVKPPPNAGLSRMSIMILEDDDLDEKEKTPIGAFNPSLPNDVSSTSMSSTYVSTTESEDSIPTTSRTKTTTKIETSTTESPSSTANEITTEEEETDDKISNAAGSISISSTKSTNKFMKTTTVNNKNGEHMSEAPFIRTTTSTYSHNNLEVKDSQEKTYHQNNSFNNINDENLFKTTTLAMTSKQTNNDSTTRLIQTNSDENKINGNISEVNITSYSQNVSIEVKTTKDKTYGTKNSNNSYANHENFSKSITKSINSDKENNTQTTTTPRLNTDSQTNSSIPLMYSQTDTLNKTVNSLEERKDSFDEFKLVTIPSIIETSKNSTNEKQDLDFNTANITNSKIGTKPTNDHSKDSLYKTTIFIPSDSFKIKKDEFKDDNDSVIEKESTEDNTYDKKNSNNSYSNNENFSESITKSNNIVIENNNQTTTTPQLNTDSQTNSSIPLMHSQRDTLNKTVNSLKGRKDSSDEFELVTIPSIIETSKNSTNENKDLDSHTANITNFKIGTKPTNDHSKDQLYKTTIITPTGSYKIEEDEVKDDNDSIIEKESTNVRSRRNIFESDTIQLSCNALRIVGQLSGIALTEEDLRGMTDSEIDECRVDFGAMDLSLQLRKHIWKRLIRTKKMQGTHLLRGLLQAATVGDIWDFDSWSISDPWVLENIHALNTYANDPTVLTKVFKEIENAGNEHTPELLAALGASLCSIDWNTSVQLPVIGLQAPVNCRPCLPMLAKKAIQLLGPVSKWTQHYVHSLNDIVAGLELQDWRELTESSLKPLFALQPSAITCLNNSHIEILTPDHISMIPTLTLHALLPEQISALNETQIQALRRATQVSIVGKLTATKPIRVEEVPSSGSYTLASSLIIFASLTFVFS